MPGVMKILHADGVRMASLEMDERGHHASAVRVPIVDDFLSVEEEAGAAAGVYAQAIIARDGRGKLPRPAHRIILRGNAPSRRYAVPFEKAVATTAPHPPARGPSSV